MEHKLDWTTNGNGNMGSITPTCACGWSGSPEYNYNDDQYTSARRQWQHHVREAGLAQAAQPAPTPVGGDKSHQSAN
ncbi:TPA: hypothetical protein L4559_003559 [Pseudomonas aeruginosa]|nr:hypothetical protein [Pseudomonas aeruginosa]